MANENIMIVEDDGILAMNLQFTVMELGYNVQYLLASGEDAIIAAESSPTPDLILMDIKLAGKIDGIAAARHISYFLDVPIIFLTSYSQDTILQKAKTTAPYGYLIKPVSTRDLEATIEMALHRHKIDRRLKESEAKLRESEARFRVIIDNTQVGYFFIDRDGRFLNVNNAWLKMHGYKSSDEVIGQHFSLTQVETDLAAAKNNIEILLAGNIIPAGEFQRRCKDGSVAYHTFSANPVVQAGEVVGIEGFIIDTTNLKHLEMEKAKIEAQNRQLQKEESLVCMAGAIAHNYNNLLSVVMGNLEMAMNYLPKNREIDEFLNDAMKASSRAAEISRLMLVYLGKIYGERKLVDLTSICASILPFLNANFPANISLKTMFPVKKMIINAIEHDIQQVLINLVKNSCEAIGSKEGEIIIKISEISADGILCNHFQPIDWTPQVNGYVCMEVLDTGSGISDHDIDRLFDPFFSTKFIGRGLGLPVVFGIVKNHGGCISVESGLNQGSCFKIFLPKLGE
ncbi:MAG: PAS domain S-box protein [Desulfobacterales bacterium]|nr:PAS domain S-box protein [Desulfobacterales bacterium]